MNGQKKKTFKHAKQVTKWARVSTNCKNLFWKILFRCLPYNV